MRSRNPVRLVPLAVLTLVIGAWGAWLPGCASSDMQPPPVLKCQAPQDCPDQAVICDAISLSCRPCRGPEDDASCRSRDPATPHCAPGGRCGECGQSADCHDPAKPSCIAGVCGLCGKPEDCASMVCRADGSCAADSDVVHVNNMKCNPANMNPAGTLADPLCEAQAGADKAFAEHKSAVEIAGSAMPYAPVSISQTTMAGVLLSGSPAGVETASIRGDAPGLSVLGGMSSQVTVVAQGLDLSSKNAEGVVCDKQAAPFSPQLTLMKSDVNTTTLVGLRANGCTLALDRVHVYNALKGGLTLTGSTYNINNVMVYNNLGPGVTVKDPGAGSLFRFATIYYNVSPGPPGGIDCNGQPTLIEDSIVVGNVKPGIGNQSQFGGCQLGKVVYGMGEPNLIPGGIAQTPDFASAATPFDLHLKNDDANKLCCIDKVPAAPGLPGLIDHDIDGTHRPQGQGWDIGAHEVQQ